MSSQKPDLAEGSDSAYSAERLSSRPVLDGPVALSRGTSTQSNKGLLKINKQLISQPIIPASKEKKGFLFKDDDPPETNDDVNLEELLGNNLKI